MFQTTNMRKVRNKGTKAFRLRMNAKDIANGDIVLVELDGHTAKATLEVTDDGASLFWPLPSGGQWEERHRVPLSHQDIADMNADDGVIRSKVRLSETPVKHKVG